MVWRSLASRRFSAAYGRTASYPVTDPAPPILKADNQTKSTASPVPDSSAAPTLPEPSPSAAAAKSPGRDSAPARLPGSDPFEQIGSETDCNAHGKMVASVWYELVPAPSHTIRMKVHPGDTIRATVTVVGKTTTVSLDDLTRHTSYTKTATLSHVDVSSADWIVEAPSQCRGASFCRVLPLANFGSATFTRARAVTTTGHRGSISNRKWETTRITLASSGQHFVDSSDSATVAQASVSPLAAAGGAFTVTYSASTSEPTPPTTQNPPPTTTNPTPGAGDLARRAPNIAQGPSRASHPALINASR